MFQKKEKKEDKVWHPQQEVLLQDWAEVSSGYRWLHDNAYRKYKRQSLAFTIPVIIMSTVTGTANFAQESFPEEWRTVVPMFIGFLNLVAAIITTICQFLKINELMEGNRVASINFGKLNRNITVELNLPHNERTNMGADFLRTCQGEFDRLVEQSPVIPTEVLNSYSKTFVDGSFAKPEINHINKVMVFQDKEARTSIIIANAANNFKEIQKKNSRRIPTFSGIVAPKDVALNSFVEEVIDDAKDEIQEEVDNQPVQVNAMKTMFEQKADNIV